MKYIAIIGFGVVGGGITSIIETNAEKIRKTVGDDVDQSSFFVDVQTTNNDPYVMIAQPSRFMSGMNE